MKIDILRNYKTIPITELKIGTFGIVVETPPEYNDYLNKLALCAYTTENDIIHIVWIESNITSIILDKRDCDHSSYKKFKVALAVIENISVRIINI